MHRCLGCMREFGEEYDVCPHCGYIVGTEAASKNHLAPGTVLQDRYTLGKALGQGGFGITYIAWDNKIGRAVAIKEYMPNALASRMTGEKEISCYNEEARRQFDLGLAKTRKEAHALSRFDKLESVVKVYDCIEENGTAYIVMELLRGRTVKEIIAERGRLSFAQTMRIMTPVLGTLDAMHGVGMIHRDVAPDNIFVCEDGKIKLLDFGAARVVSDTDEKTLSVMLKAGYAPVEQYSSKAKQGAFTDVYAACAAMYKMLTGETPPDSFTRDKDGSDLKALTQTDVPQSAQETIRHGMALNAADRIQSAKELLDALRKDLPENVEGIDPKQFLKNYRKRKIKKRGIVSLGILIITVTAISLLLALQNKESISTLTEAESINFAKNDTEESNTSITEQSVSEAATIDDDGVTADILREKLTKESEKEVLSFSCQDYNGDGELEAFAVLDYGNGNTENKNQIWFVNKKQSSYVATLFAFGNGKENSTIPINTSGTKYAYCQYTVGADGSSYYQVFYVNHNGDWMDSGLSITKESGYETVPCDIPSFCTLYEDQSREWILVDYGNKTAGMYHTEDLQYVYFDEKKDAFIELGAIEIKKEDALRIKGTQSAFDKIPTNASIKYILYRDDGRMGCINIVFSYQKNDPYNDSGKYTATDCVTAFIQNQEVSQINHSISKLYNNEMIDRFVSIKLSDRLEVTYPKKFPF